MEPRMQVSVLSSSEDESPFLVTKKRSWKKSTKHSTPEETALGWRSPRPPRGTSHLLGSPVPSQSSKDLMSQLAGVSPIATFRKRKLSTIRASEGTSGQLGSYLDDPAPGKDPPVSASLAKQEQKREAREAKRWPGTSGLPGIPDITRKKRRDQKGQEAVMQRVRQWESCLLQEIEEAVHHELFIQAE
ncbi:coiled-coil domain-containing protein 201 [Marmota monax]|uniref:coiled-coil domain-containing protein 201 n=1 Tax=Marmota flaviventris TaxID=93162 RepID=UPI00148EE44C|nr:coiled-coil domain-containing protein 201-like [Marmota flaviventris]XP_046293794.1 coiled-coil domain-containing protein 201 [Marmota monax]